MCQSAKEEQKKVELQNKMARQILADARAQAGALAAEQNVERMKGKIAAQQEFVASTAKP